MFGNFFKSDIPKRPMIYPYTLTARLMQFPFRTYWDYTPLFKYWVLAIFVSMPLFYKIQQLTYSPANVEKWREIDMRELYGPNYKEKGRH